jgi:cyclophilin family peptidyl-prolyl cis-trans isomerase
MHHTIFGEVAEGYDVVQKIENCETGFMDRPVQEQKILSVVVE